MTKKMVNRQYWDNFYKNDFCPTKQSAFSLFVAEEIKKRTLKNIKIIDIACGNGRDTKFFSNFYDTKGIDLSFIGDNTFNYEKANMFEYDYSNFNVFYLRFVVHSMTEEELGELIDIFVKQKTQEDKYIFIETRSITGKADGEKKETFYKSSIGKEHYRMLYSKKYLDQKFKKHFTVEYSSESNEYSIYNGEKPFCIRYILKI